LGQFTKTGNVEIDRLAIGQRNKAEDYKYPELYSEERYISTTRRKIARRLKYQNWTDFKNNSSDEQKEQFQTMFDEFIAKNPYDPDKKKCIGNAWYIPYTPTSKLVKEAGIGTDSGSRELGRGDHPATYPEGLPTQCIKFSGIPNGSKVYDPFNGTGTTIVASIKLGMYGIGTDIDQKYLNFSEKRIANVLQELNKPENTLFD
jgi:DNA modification methylase